MVEYLDPEIAGEGVSADNWTAPVPKAHLPSYEGIKAIQKYFPEFSGRPYQHQTFPCWLYHPGEEPRLISDELRYDDQLRPVVIRKASEIARELGCVYRNSTVEERAQGFPAARWEFDPGSKWRPFPHDVRFDPKKAPHKTVVLPQSQGSAGMVNADVIAATVAAVLAKTSETGAVVDADRAEFEAFKAWKAQQASAAAEPPPQVNSLAPADETDRDAAIALAGERGVKIDKRWTLDKIMAELEKAA